MKTIAVCCAALLCGCSITGHLERRQYRADVLHVSREQREREREARERERHDREARDRDRERREREARERDRRDRERPVRPNPGRCDYDRYNPKTGQCLPSSESMP